MKVAKPRTTKKVVCCKCHKAQTVPANERIARFGRSGIVCAQKIRGVRCCGEFKLA